MIVLPKQQAVGFQLDVATLQGWGLPKRSSPASLVEAPDLLGGMAVLGWSPITVNPGG
jgi:hypothetical protein